MGRAGFFFCLSLSSLFRIVVFKFRHQSGYGIKRLRIFYLCSQDYGTLCFLPSDRDTQIPHGRLLSTAWSSAVCHWHRSPSNRSKSSTPATVRPLRHQPQPNKHVPSEGKMRADRNGRKYSDHYSLSYWKPIKQMLCEMQKFTGQLVKFEDSDFQSGVCFVFCLFFQLEFPNKVRDKRE